MQAEFFALEGLTQHLKVIDLVNSRLSRNLKLLGMIITMFNARTRSSKEEDKKVTPRAILCKDEAKKFY